MEEYVRSEIGRSKFCGCDTIASVGTVLLNNVRI